MKNCPRAGVLVDDDAGIGGRKSSRTTWTILKPDSAYFKVTLDEGRVVVVVGQGAEELDVKAELGQNGAVVGGVAAAGGPLIDGTHVRVLNGKLFHEVDDVDADKADAQDVTFRRRHFGVEQHDDVFYKTFQQFLTPKPVLNESKQASKILIFHKNDLSGTKC